jgi:pimeloyl-ACP methyl ester carboxylesterase
MKYIPRIAGLLLGAILLVGAFPSQVVSLSPHQSPPQVAASSPVTLDFSKPPVDDWEVILPVSPVVVQTPALTDVPRRTAPVRGDDNPKERPPKAATPTAAPLPLVEPLNPYIHLPPDAAQHQPLRVLVALHGMNGQGETFAKPLIADADRNHWVLVAPTIPYHNHLDLKELLEDDVLFARALEASLKTLPDRIHLAVQPDVILFGFSRGAQLAHRFAFFYPERVSSVVAISAGTYTLPTEEMGVGSGSQALPLPFGVGDCQAYGYRPVDWESFKKISFWIAVGAKDDQPGEVPRAFDPYIGSTRVARACAFNSALEKVGVKSHLVIFPNVGHEMTAEICQEAMKFLHERELQAETGH